MDPTSLANPTVLSKTAHIQNMLALHDAVENDERPLLVHVTAHREGDEPRDFGTVAVGEREVRVTAELDSSETEMALAGMILSMYGDVLVLTAASALATHLDCESNDDTRPHTGTFA